MWIRFAKRLRCSVCKGELELFSFQEMRVEISAGHAELARRLGVLDADFNRYIEAGLLVCHSCKTWFPIFRGLPILLLYTTPAHNEFFAQFRQNVSGLPASYAFASREPVPGERFVLTSFSTEWREYDYDGVIWEMSYEDHEKRFLTEMDFRSLGINGSGFLEVGCGLGITTYCAHAKYKTDAVGVDLSQAAFRAAQQYRTNPFLHFVQASAFFLPFPEKSFDVLYSRGVLHHTYSTREAFQSVARYCRPGGGLYLWVYGKGSINETVFRRAAFLAEAMTRPVFSRRPESWSSLAFLSCLGFGYMTYNAFRRFRNPGIQKLNFRRAVHAARDRFTPRYAHRHASQEVVDWFKQAGFREIEIVDWRAMPAADWEDYRRNVGVRGIRAES